MKKINTNELQKADGPAGQSAAPCYARFRGKCKEMVDELCRRDTTLTPVRGYYVCWSWGKQGHWWAIKPDGKIVDPTIDQFPTPHIGEYVPFDGIVDCAQCGKKMNEEEVVNHYGRYGFCSLKCQCTFFGV